MKFIQLNKKNLYITKLHKINRSFDKEPDKLIKPLQSIWQQRWNTKVMKSFFNLVRAKMNISEKDRFTVH
jgi:hypothetical protein